MNKRIFYFDNFRAVAIMFIILGHCYDGWARKSLWEIFINNAITGATALFVFISGFFFHTVFYEKFNYTSFIKKKFFNIVLPYLILSITYMLIYFLLEKEIPFPKNLGIDNNVYRLIINIFSGRHLLAYWYIPFAFSLFLISPLFISFIHLSKLSQLVLLVIFFLISSVVHRPTLEINPLHNIIYFSFFYLMGIFFSQYQKIMEEILKKNTVIIAIIWSCSTLAMSALGQIGNLSKWSLWQYNGIDWMVLQKLFFIFFLIGLLLNFANKRLVILNFIASISFPLFFIHPWILTLLPSLRIPRIENHGFLNFLMISAIVILLSIAMIMLIKFLLGRYSRCVVGR